MNTFLKNKQSKKYSILQNIFKYSFVLIFLLMVVLPVIPGVSHNPGYAIAADDEEFGNKGDEEFGNKGVNIDVKIQNPLGDKLTDLPSFMEALLDIVLKIGVPIVALAIIYTGFLFVSAQGNSEKLTTAKKALMYTLIGAALLLGAWMLANAIVGTVDQIRTEAK